MSMVEADLRAIAERADVMALVRVLQESDEATLETQIELTEIPAPPFGEEARAKRVAQLLQEAGLQDVGMDETGNVSACLPGEIQVPPLMVTAHLDTVFPAETDVTVTRQGPLLRGPGISDDGRGLAALVALAQAFGAGDVRTRKPVRFVATVGEEGAGDLRGVKGLFGKDPAVVARADMPTPADQVASAFISLDGAGIERIVSRGLGSRRFRITIHGAGGHSWVDWGVANPAHALVTLGARLTALELPTDPRTTLTVARLGGGKSINAIPQESWLEIDCRSTDEDALANLVAGVEKVVRAEASESGELDYQMHVIGDRPGGATADGHPLVQAALAATRLLGTEPRLARSSTDANVPMACGVPAITLGCGGEAGKAHTTDEWYRNTKGPDGIVRALYVILAVAGLAEN
ncbi:MAG: M20/M25/M40 family metallo-hydrolase [Gemmatimonadetes bacterium]|nr:M20/M25/M40 family metallo-hydrolase [Gemmatimonadota bacterium]